MAFALRVYILLKKKDLIISSVYATWQSEWSRAEVPKVRSPDHSISITWEFGPAFDLEWGPAISIFISGPGNFKTCQNLRTITVSQFRFSKVLVSFGRYCSVPLNGFSMFTKLCHHHHNLSRTFLSPHWIPKQSFPTLQPLTATNLLSVSIDLHILDISYKWDHTVCAILWLASFHIVQCLKGFSVL